MAVGSGEEPGEIADMQPTYVKGLPFTATCTIDKDGRTLYGMVPRELRMIDEAPQALTVNVNGVEIGPGDKVIYTTGVGGTDEVKSTVEQVVRGGETWAIVLRVERGEGDTTAILLTEPRIGALRSLEPAENATKNDTIGGDPHGQRSDPDAGDRERRQRLHLDGGGRRDVDGANDRVRRETRRHELSRTPVGLARLERSVAGWRSPSTDAAAPGASE